MSGPQPQRHKKLLYFIRAEVEAHGIAPSFSEMQIFLGLKSKSGIHRILGHLERGRLIRRLPYRANAIELLEAKDYHLPNCDCDGCAATRYFEQLKLVKAIRFQPPLAIRNDQATNFRRLTDADRASLLGNPDIVGPLPRTALPGGGR